MKLCWLIPSDCSGGITSAVLSCCRQAAQAGHVTTMLMVVTPTWMTGQSFQVSSLGLYARAPETPKVLLQWLEENPQDILFFNSCEELDAVIPYLPPNNKCVFVVHDTAYPYWRRALQEEDNLEAIVAVSETVARKFRHRLKQRRKLSVIHNGCVFPEAPALDRIRQDDLLFLGADNPAKGAFDVLRLWKQLMKLGFSGKLHWFGELSPEFKAKIARLPNSERIHHYGFVKRDSIFSLAASAKVLLMLSCVESFGMVTVEAMSMGCVPVAWDIDIGTKEIVCANKTGLFAPLGDTNTLARQVLYACEHHPTFSRVVVEHARSYFNETVMWQRYDSLSNQIAKLQPIERCKLGQQPMPYQPSFHYFQRLPRHLRLAIRELIGRSPSLSYWLRDLRGL